LVVTSRKSNFVDKKEYEKHQNQKENDND